MEKIDIPSFFPQIGAKQWKQQIQYELQGADYNNSLVWESPEGIRVKPFYTSEDLSGNGSAIPHREGPWLAGHAIHVGAGTEANQIARKAIENGAEALEFHIPTDEVPMESLLREINLHTTELHCHFGFLSESYIQSFLEGLPPNPRRIFLHLDAIGHLARTGNWFANQKEDTETIRRLLKSLAGHKYIVPVGIDGGLYQNAGANIVQQLAYTLAHAEECLHVFGDGWRPPVSVRLSTGSDYFFEIAKLRAFRWLWATLAEAYDTSPECHILATPSLRNKTYYGYNSNIFRTAGECMAAVVGGADTVVNLPYDSLFRKPNDFSSRLAINQLLILKNEAHFNDVSNPADGAYYLEVLTRQLAEKSLALFKQIAAGGGFLRQLKEHKIQNKVRESAALEQLRFDKGELVLVGTNAYKDEGERIESQFKIDLNGSGEARKTTIEPVLEKRLATKMEHKRLADE